MAFVARPDFWVEYLAANLMMFLAQALPLRAALRWGECAGRLAAVLARCRKRIAVENIRHAYPELSEKEAEKLAVRVFQHFGRAVVEGAVAHRLLRPSTYRQHVQIRHEERLRQVLAAGKGGIMVTAHLGIWEVVGLLQHLKGLPMHNVYRPAKNPLVDRMVRRRRMAIGQVMVDREGALAILLRVLRRNGYIGLLIDQHAKRDGVWVPFFGRLASTTPAPALLALRTGAPILTGYARRLPGTYQFEVFIDEPIYANPTGDRAADIERITRELSLRIEGYVRQFPEQWLWLHRRWREPPPEVMARENTNVRSPGKAH